MCGSNYLARNSFLLQQGHFAADILYFYGEDSNLTVLFAKKAPDLPAGYGFDYINADGLIHELNVSDGRITTEERHEAIGCWCLTHTASTCRFRFCGLCIPWFGREALWRGPNPLKILAWPTIMADFHKLNDELFGDGRRYSGGWQRQSLCRPDCRKRR